MSVEHYDCDNCCNTGVYEEYIESCEECGNMICSWCIWDKEGWYIKDEYINEDWNLKSEFCPICIGNKRNKDKVKVWNKFTTEYFWKMVEVEIINVK